MKKPPANLSRVRTSGFSLSDLTQTFKNAKTLLKTGQRGEDLSY